MVSGFSKKSRIEPTWLELEHAIRRNFGGLDCIDPVKIFADKMQNVGKRQAVRRYQPMSTRWHILHYLIHCVDIFSYF